MEWIERLNGTINYIEENLTEEINLEEIAKIACCSAYHYQRMFGYLAEMPLSEYIRKRKMSRAAVDLMDGDKVLDVALRYGYDSPTAFNRAFRSVHGIAPSEVKKCSGSLKAYPPISFKVTIKGEYEMEYKIVKKDAFRILGVSTPLSHTMEENGPVLAKLWQDSASDGTIARLASLAKSDAPYVLGVSTCNEQFDWTYYISVISDEEVPGLSGHLLPAATWAVFSARGSQLSIVDMEVRIVSEWLPTSGYEYDNAPDIEAYIDPDPSTGRYEVWIPVVKKSGTAPSFMEGMENSPASHVEKQCKNMKQEKNNE